MTLIRKKEPSKPDLDARLEHTRWCMKNGFIVYFEPINNREVLICTDNNGIISQSEEAYNQFKFRRKETVIWEKMYNLYTNYYNENYGKTN